MKTINYQEVIEDIDQRLKKFDESRILNNKSEDYQLPKTSDINNITYKEFDNVNNINSEISYDQIINDPTVANNTNSIQEIKNKKIQEVTATLQLVTDDFVARDDFEIEKKAIDEKKLANFRKNDNFFLENELTINDTPKKETTNFFRSISDFFNDNKKDVKQKVIPVKKIELKVEQEPTIINTENYEDVQLVEIIPEKSQDEIEVENAIKIEKLRLIEEEYRLKAETRMADEKLLGEKTAAALKKSTTDFRKNKRKK